MKIDQIILASSSPRRKELLEQLGVKFQMMAALGEEIPKGNTPEEIVCYLSKNKAVEVAKSLMEKGLKKEEERNINLVIGADTVVVLEGKILGKPRDERDAMEMLSRLSGRQHCVYTGVTLILVKDGTFHLIESFSEETLVKVYPMNKEEITNYIQTGDPMDKAGAYGIQGVFARYIKEITGEYCNVVGLPIGHLWQSLKKLEDLS